jgi:hypothetical protein
VFADARKEPGMVAAIDMPALPQEPVPSFVEPPRSGRIPVDEITAKARQARPGHALLTGIGWVLFGGAWAVTKLLGCLWLALSWCWTACQMGIADAQGKGPSKSSLIEENRELRLAIKRLGGEA